MAPESSFAAEKKERTSCRVCIGMGAAKVLGDLHRPSGKLFFDIRTVAFMREHGVCEIYTTDTASFQFQDLWVITP